MDATKLAELRGFVELCEKNPSILADPSLKFFRDFLLSWDAKVPKAAFRVEEVKNEEKKEKEVEDEAEDVFEDASGDAKVEEEDEPEEVEIVESDVELETEGVVAADDGPPQKMGDASREITEEERDAAQVAKAKAMEALADGEFEAAVEHLTEAILANPSSSILYGNRAGVYVKLKKPNAAIRDCDEALKLNADSARAYKARGQAHTLLGNWEAAARDLRLAAQLDYDEDTNALLHKVEPNVHRLEEHRRKYARLRKEREERIAAKERAKRKEAAKAAYEAEKRRERESSQSRPSRPPGGGFPGGMPAGMGFGGMPGGMPGFGGAGGMPAGMGFGGAGGMPGGMPGFGGPGGMGGGAGGMPDMSSFLKDPELMAAFQDPAVMAAMQDVMKNPSNLLKYQSDPKVGPVLMKLMAKFSGGAK